MKKNLVLLCLVMILIGMNGAKVVSAQDIIVENVEKVQGIEYSTNEYVTMVSDKIVPIFRNNNGQLQYRRWNQTKGFWVDPYWINV